MHADVRGEISSLRLRTAANFRALAIDKSLNELNNARANLTRNRVTPQIQASSKNTYLCS